MVGDKVKYTCKNCGWMTAIRKEWADLRPRRCMNRKCNTSFQKWPEALVIQLPEKQDAPKQSEKPASKKGKKIEQPKND